MTLSEIITSGLFEAALVGFSIGLLVGTIGLLPSLILTAKVKR